jgi:hypothetical protein
MIISKRMSVLESEIWVVTERGEIWRQILALPVKSRVIPQRLFASSEALLTMWEQFLLRLLERD